MVRVPFSVHPSHHVPRVQAPASSFLPEFVPNILRRFGVHTASLLPPRPAMRYSTRKGYPLGDRSDTDAWRNMGPIRPRVFGHVSIRPLALGRENLLRPRRR